MKIIISGGGTGGPVTPLLAVAAELKKLDPSVRLLFVGTSKGPEKQLSFEAGIDFVSIPSAKFRRYFSLKNVTDVLNLVRAFFKSLGVIKHFQPDLVFSVGGFVSVPMAWAAKMRKVKVIIHQQDAQAGLANKLIAPFADLVTTTFEASTKEFLSGWHAGKDFKRQVVCTGNPVRAEFFDRNVVTTEFSRLHKELPVLLIFGGASGASQINTVVLAAMSELVKSHQVIHITGAGNTNEFQDPNYHQYEFLGKEMPAAMKLADIVVCRAGLSTLAELSVLGKVAVIVPMPGSHQEANAEIIRERSAAVVLGKNEFDPENLVRVINSLKFNPKRNELLRKNIFEIMPHDAAARIAQLIKGTYESR